jgi:radical SAM superfamily enzyme YgiQ (UPF0313 family)
MTWVFVGIETPNQESLRETKKRQNLGIDLLQQVREFLSHGISVTGGMMLGFDHDGPDIFARQLEFAMASPIPIFSVGALVAPAATPLYTRIQQAGRLVGGGSEVAASPFDTNIVPARMSREELLEGLRWLCLEIYRPANFGRRVLQMIEALRPAPNAECGTPAPPRAIEREALIVMQRLMDEGDEERRMMLSVLRAMQAKPGSEKLVLAALYRYTQVRCLYASAGFARCAAGAGLQLLNTP